MSQNTENKEASKTHKMPSKKHQALVERYLIHFNASKAHGEVFGTKAGHSRDASASEIMRRPDVQQYLNTRLAERKAELHLDTQYVVRKLTEIVEADFVDSTQYLTKEQLDQIPVEIRKLIQSIEINKTVNKTSTNSGDYTTQNEKYKVTFMSKDAAIIALGKHTGAFIKDNVTANVNLDQMSFTDAVKKLDL